MTGLALTLRSHRYEMLVSGALAILALGAALFVVLRLSTAGIPLECFQQAGGTCFAFQGLVEDYLNFARDKGLLALGGITILPILSGLVIGITLAGKEIDRGTVVFAWSMSPSRRRWLLDRVVPIGVAVVVLSLAGGVLADRLEALRDPGVNPDRSFEHLGLRGIVVGAEALAAFGVSLATGAVFGRILPALLIGGALALGSVALVTIGSDTLLRNETVIVDGVDGGPTGAERWREVDYRVRDPKDGTIITWNEAYERYGQTVDPENPEVDWTQQLTSVLLVNPGEMYPLAADRMALFYAVIGLAGCVITFYAVDRRRPA
jgi:hypothetical protein